MNTQNIFLIYPPIERYLGWFKSLALVNSAAVNTGVKESITSFGYDIHIIDSLDICQRVVFLIHMVVLLLVIWRNSILLSIVVAIIYSSTKSVQGFLFCPYTCQHLLVFELLMTAIPTEMRWNLNVILICISYMARDVVHYLYFSGLVLVLKRCCF
jgi:hypothetical protein